MSKAYGSYGIGGNGRMSIAIAVDGGKCMLMIPSFSCAMILCIAQSDRT